MIHKSEPPFASLLVPVLELNSIDILIEINKNNSGGTLLELESRAVIMRDGGIHKG